MSFLPMLKGGIYSYVGMIIHSSTLDTEAKVKEIYGGDTWILHDGYMLRGASTGVTPNSAISDGGADTHTLTVAEMPGHRHWISAGTYDDGNCSTTGTSNSQDYGLMADVGSYNSNDSCKAYGRYGAYGGASNGVNGKWTSAGTTSAHNNLPSYKSVYIWERVE